MADRKAGAGQAETEPRPAAVTFVTTEHFTLQGARSSTIAEGPAGRRCSSARSAGDWLPSG
jgi:hypothetical protein